MFYFYLTLCDEVWQACRSLHEGFPTLLVNEILETEVLEAGEIACTLLAKKNKQIKSEQRKLIMLPDAVQHYNSCPACVCRRVFRRAEKVFLLLLSLTPRKANRYCRNVLDFCQKSTVLQQNGCLSVTVALSCSFRCTSKRWPTYSPRRPSPTIHSISATSLGSCSAVCSSRSKRLKARRLSSGQWFASRN